MPSWHLGTNIRNEIIERASYIMGTRMAYACDGAPFTPEQFQLLTVTDSQLVALQELEADGMVDLPRVTELPVRFLRSRYPGLTRGVALKFRFRTAIYGAMRWLDACSDMFQDDDAQRGFLATPERLPLSPEQIAWLNRYALEVRCGELVNTTVRHIMGITKTSADLLANFKFLATIVEDKTWRERFQGPVKITARHRMTPEQLNHNMLRKRALVTDTLLTGGLLLGKHDGSTPRAVNPVLIQIEKLSTDLEF